MALRGWVIKENTASAWLSWERGFGILELSCRKSGYLEATMPERLQRETTEDREMPKKQQLSQPAAV